MDLFEYTCLCIHELEEQMENGEYSWKMFERLASLYIVRDHLEGEGDDMPNSRSAGYSSRRNGNGGNRGRQSTDVTNALQNLSKEELVVVMTEHMDEMRKHGNRSEYDKMMDEIRRVG